MQSFMLTSGYSTLEFANHDQHSLVLFTQENRMMSIGFDFGTTGSIIDLEKYYELDELGIVRKAKIFLDRQQFLNN